MDYSDSYQFKGHLFKIGIRGAKEHYFVELTEVYLSIEIHITIAIGQNFREFLAVFSGLNPDCEQINESQVVLAILGEQSMGRLFWGQN